MPIAIAAPRRSPARDDNMRDQIDDDELVEVTPESIRIRKRTLDHSKREVAAKKIKKAELAEA